MEKEKKRGRKEGEKSLVCLLICSSVEKKEKNGRKKN
jgi:hypothetical protein